MEALKTILVIADPRLRESPALERGAQLAKASAAVLRLALFDFDWSADERHDPEGRGHATFMLERGRWLGEQATRLRERGIKVSSEVVETEELPRGVLAKVLEQAPDLVVRDIHDAGQYEHRVFSPEEEEVLTLCPAPLMLVRGAVNQPGPIVATISLSRGAGAAQPVADAVAEAARGLGAAIGAEVHLAHVCRAQTDFGGEGYSILRDAEAASQEADHAQFDAFARQAGFAAERSHWLVGDAADAVGKLVARLGARILVMGNVYHSVLDRLWNDVRGSTTEQLVSHTACDAVFAKPADYKVTLARHVDFEDVCRQHKVLLTKAA